MVSLQGLSSEEGGGRGLTVDATVRNSSTMAANTCQPAVLGGPRSFGYTCTMNRDRPSSCASSASGSGTTYTVYEPSPYLHTRPAVTTTAPSRCSPAPFAELRTALIASIVAGALKTKGHRKIKGHRKTKGRSGRRCWRAPLVQAALHGSENGLGVLAGVAAQERGAGDLAALPEQWPLDVLHEERRVPQDLGLDDLHDVV